MGQSWSFCEIGPAIDRESERYWLDAEGSEFVAEVGRWTIRELLHAVVEDFQAAAKETARRM